MSNAAKHRKKAAEFEQLKQIDRAIASYIKAIDESEEGGEEVDVALLNKVGDLTLRQGRVADAVTYYERAVEHYASSGLFNNAIALCNKILRSSPGRAKVYFTLGRICAKKGLRGDATRNFLEYATRMQQEGRVDEGMRALAEIANLMPELVEIRRLVDEHAERAGIVLERRKTPFVPPAQLADPAFPNRVNKSSELVFLDTEDPQAVRRHTPPLAPRIRVGVTPAMAKAEAKASLKTPSVGQKSTSQPAIDGFLLFDPSRPGAVTPPGVIKAVVEMPLEEPPQTPLDDLRDETTREIDAVVDLLAEVPDDIGQDEPSPIAEQTEPTEQTEQEDEPGSSESAPIFESILDPEPEITVETLEGLVFEDDLLPDAVSLQSDASAPSDDAPSASLEGQDANGLAFLDDVTPVDGLETSNDDVASTPDLEFLVDSETANNDVMADHAALQGGPDNPLTWLTPVDADDLSFASALGATDVQSDEDRRPLEFLAIEELSVDELPVDALSVDELPVDELPVDELPVEEIPTSTLADLVVEDFEHVADDSNAIIVTGGRPGTPAYGSTPVGSLTPIDVSRIPEIEEAIEAGALAAARAEADPELALRRPPMRFDPHNFILPGELPPLAVDDEFTELGMSGALQAEEDAAIEPSASQAEPQIAEVRDDEPAAAEASDGDFGPLVTPNLPVEAVVLSNDVAEDAWAADDDVDESSPTLEVLAPRPDASSGSPETTAAVAAEANAVASSRRAELQAAVDYSPQDFALRRRLAEALFEVGARESGLTELQVALSGFAQAGDLSTAAEIADELVRISPERIQYHQKRVELAVRLSDQALLRLAYLDLADTLVRMGDDIRAHAVYARVLEIDPWDERARSALGAAAPPPPPPPTSDDEFIDLAAFLQDGETASTRMRMREPEVSGNEQADFDSLLRHFKEGVARSLEEEDYESHYDLGVAYKEMGLLDDAIAEFQKALRSRRHRLPAYEALGQCFVEQSRHSVAATVLTRALHEPGLGDEQRIGVLYLLAYSCEALQRWNEARSYYSRVYATDINFRDAAARLAALEQIAQ